MAQRPTNRSARNGVGSVSRRRRASKAETEKRAGHVHVDVFANALERLVKANSFPPPIDQLCEMAEYFKSAEAEATKLFDLFQRTDIVFAQVDQYVRCHPPSAGAIAVLLELSKPLFRTESQRNAALARSARFLPAKTFVMTNWAQNRGGCESKAEFSRIFSARVLNEFGIKVTSRTIETEWLPKG